ncbi:hypothetical protein [Staphylococcus phage vB_StaM_PB50]|nr:hypothetical protein [Staphylococcus phage vB_StaM_PB50]
MKNNRDVSDELERIISNVDEVDVKSVFKDVRYTELNDEMEDQEEQSNSSKYHGSIQGIVTKEEYDKLPYLGKKVIQFMENIVGDKEGMTFEEYFERYAKVYGEGEIDSFKNTMYRLKSSKVFTIHSLISICEVIGYKVSLVSEEFKDKDELTLYNPKRKTKTSKFSGKLGFKLMPDVLYEEYILEFVDFLEILGNEGYTFEMLFGELEKNSDEVNVVSKLKSSLDKMIKQGKLTWKTMETVINSLGMNLKIEFIKETIDTDEINKMDAGNKIELSDDDIIRG